MNLEKEFLIIVPARKGSQRIKVKIQNKMVNLYIIGP